MDQTKAEVVALDLLEMMFHQSPGFAAVVVGQDHQILMANKTYTELVGERDLIGRPLAEAMPELPEQGVVKILDQINQGGKPYVGTSLLISFVRQQNAPATPRFLDVVLQPFKLHDGSVAAILMLGTDVTDRVVAQQELQARESMFRETLDALPIGIVLFDRFSVVRMVNEHFAQSRGLPISELVGTHLRDLVGDTSYALRKPVVDAVLRGETREFEEIRLAANGAPHRHFQKYFPRMHDGEVVGFYGTTIDITLRLASAVDESPSLN